MTAWKSSTLLVLAAFAVSVVLLFAKSGLMRERNADSKVIVSNHIYSPAAADPELRVPERAERMTRTSSKPKASAEPKPLPVSTNLESPAKAPETKEPKKEPAPLPARKQVPKQGENVFYVVCATFSSKENAEKGLSNLKNKGLQEAFVGTFDDGKFYSVIGNTFADEASARFMVSELLRKHKIKAYIYHKKD